MRKTHTIVLASTNRHKLLEFESLIKSNPDVQIVSAEKIIRNAERLAVVEKYDSYLENAIAKARLANQASHYPCMGDDSGLEVEALDGKPGVLSRRFAEPKAGVSQDQANMDKLLESLKGRPMANRGARFHCALALIMEGMMITGSGFLSGTIAEAPRGENGFGYDPLFIPEGHRKTLAEMTEDEKNAISHRARALQDLLAKIRAKGVLLAKP